MTVIVRPGGADFGLDQFVGLVGLGEIIVFTEQISLGAAPGEEQEFVGGKVGGLTRGDADGGIRADGGVKRGHHAITTGDLYGPNFKRDGGRTAAVVDAAEGDFCVVLAGHGHDVDREEEAPGHIL